MSTITYDITGTQLYDLRELLESIVEDLQSDSNLNLISIESKLHKMAHILKIDLSTDALNIERPSKSLRMLNSYLNNNSYDKIKQHLEKQYINF